MSTRDPVRSARPPGRRLGARDLVPDARSPASALFVLALAHYLHPALPVRPGSAERRVDRDDALEQLVWRTLDWLMLMFVLFHAFMGVRTVVGDYTQRRRRGPRSRWLLYLGAHRPVRRSGTIVLVTLPTAGARAAVTAARSATHDALIVGAGGAGLWAALELRQGRASTPRS